MQSVLDTAIEAHAEEAFAFLAALVRAPSTVGAEQAALDVFAREAGSLGFNVERLPFSNEPESDPRAGISQPAHLLGSDRYQVLATTPGDGDLLLLLNGHMDVVPANNHHLWTVPPFQPDRRDNRLYGRGAADMKCGFAIGILALRALRDVVPNLFAKRRLGFLAVIEEECTGNGTLRSIINHGVRAPEVIVLESTDLDLMVGGVGVLWVDINVIASSSHAQTASTHLNAIDLEMRLINGLRKWSEEVRRAEPEPSMGNDARPYNINLGKLHAGDWTSSSPASAMFSVRIGFPRSWSLAEAEDKVRKTIAAIADTDPDFPIQPEITLSGLRAKGYLLDPDTPLLRDLSAAHADAHGIPPRTFSIGSTTDARTYCNDFGIPAVCYGAVGRRFHGIDEYVELQSIVDAARTLSRFLLMRFGAQEDSA